MVDLGCQPGDPANAVLPWAHGEQLPPLTINRSSSLAPYMTRHLRRCAIVVDRHLHKNGGSTMRDLFLEHERQGRALYYGYTHERWADDLRALAHSVDTALRRGDTTGAQVLLIESHGAGMQTGL